MSAETQEKLIDPVIEQPRAIARGEYMVGWMPDPVGYLMLAFCKPHINGRHDLQRMDMVKYASMESLLCSRLGITKPDLIQLVTENDKYTNMEDRINWFMHWCRSHGIGVQALLPHVLEDEEREGIQL